ncbi:hypothetical protein C0J50_9897 [Silurus asotus]|uniref:Uncharacterized protein n=1 Tax=Silurus asotus TaxID=30991 RepID=A0AAD5F8Y7_SILAS|nr:hypothetical protein C0J50_9897 [Silurus asotus]
MNSSYANSSPLLLFLSRSRGILRLASSSDIPPHDDYRCRTRKHPEPSRDVPVPVGSRYMCGFNIGLPGVFKGSGMEKLMAWRCCTSSTSPSPPSANSSPISTGTLSANDTCGGRC